MEPRQRLLSTLALQTPVVFTAVRRTRIDVSSSPVEQLLLGSGSVFLVLRAPRKVTAVLGEFAFEVLIVSAVITLRLVTQR